MTEARFAVDVAVAFATELVAGTAFYAPEIEQTASFEGADQPATLVTFRFGEFLGVALVVGSKANIDRAIQNTSASGPVTLWARADLPGFTFGGLALLSGSIVPSLSGGVPAFA